MNDWKPYLESICHKYGQWWKSYTITDVVGKNRDKQVAKSLLFDLQASLFQPEIQKPDREILDRERLSAVREEREVLNVLDGLRKYASEHVLLVGRPGSGKSTALIRLLLEDAERFREQEDEGEKTVIAIAGKQNKANQEEHFL